MNKRENELKVHSLGSGFRNNIKRVSYDDGDMKQAIVDKYGNILTPFFKNIICILALDENSGLVIGNNNSENELYYEYCDLRNPDRSCGDKINSKYEVESVKRINEDVLLITTKNGSSFIDSIYLKQLSDIYDSLYFDDGINSWVFQKVINEGDISTVITGPIGLDGRVGTCAYDLFFNKLRPLKKRDSKSKNVFDIIETDVIVEELKLKNEQDKAKKLARFQNKK
jgi:hypothetical protein